MSIVTSSEISMMKEIDDSVTTTESLESTSRSGDSGESYSVFGDGECSDPLQTQHLVIDFTPIEEVDDDYNQKKCCAFWELLSTRHDLRHLKVFPEKNAYKASKTTTTDYSIVESENNEKVIEKTAVSMLSFVEDKGLIDRTFEAKLPRSICSLGSREYMFNDAAGSGTFLPARNETVCTCRGVCNSCSRKKASHRPPSSEVRDISKEMMEWDAKHPKSMDPPGHPPALSHYSLQRKAT